MSEETNFRTMTWVLTEKEYASVVAADGHRRYEYFIHRVCDTKKLWMLYADGWASLSEGEQQLIPFWPHEQYAAQFRTGEWAPYEPKPVDLHEFLDRWIPGMRKEGIGPAVFPVPSGSAILVSLDDLEANLRHELAEYHGDGEA